MKKSKKYLIIMLAVVLLVLAIVVGIMCSMYFGAKDEMKSKIIYRSEYMPVTQVQDCEIVTAFIN